MQAGGLLFRLTLRQLSTNIRRLPAGGDGRLRQDLLFAYPRTAINLHLN